MTTLRRRLARHELFVRLTRVWVGRVTIVLLIGAFVVGVVGLIAHTNAVDYHLGVETIAVLAGLTGLFAERRAAAVERRQAAVRAVETALSDNIELLETDSRFRPQEKMRPEPRLYPRVDVSAVEICLSQGALMDDGDADRAAVLAEWRERAETFNRGLNLIEQLFYGLHFAAPNAREVMVKVDDELQMQRKKMAEETRAIQGNLAR